VFVCVCVQRTLNALWLPELSGDERREKDGMELEMTYEWLAHVRAATLIELWSELNGALEPRPQPQMSKSRNLIVSAEPRSSWTLREMRNSPVVSPDSPHSHASSAHTRVTYARGCRRVAGRVCAAQC
jgi:hypothetical protein